MENLIELLKEIDKKLDVITEMYNRCLVATEKQIEMFDGMQVTENIEKMNFVENNSEKSVEK